MKLKFYSALMLGALIAGCNAPNAAPTKAPPPAATLPALPTALPVASIVPQPTATVVAPVATPVAATADPTPKVRTIWNTVIGVNKSEGTCAGNPILPAYGQVQLTPSADALEYKNQQTTYLFKRSRPGEWRFAGPSPLNDGAVDMTLTFKDDRNLTVVHKLVPGKDPGCTHTFTYSGTFMWERP
jgi:hypothetical protein